MFNVHAKPICLCAGNVLRCINIIFVTFDNTTATQNIVFIAYNKLHYRDRTYNITYMYIICIKLTSIWRQHYIDFMKWKKTTSHLPWITISLVCTNQHNRCAITNNVTVWCTINDTITLGIMGELTLGEIQRYYTFIKQGDSVAGGGNTGQCYTNVLHN